MIVTVPPCKGLREWRLIKTGHTYPTQSLLDLLYNSQAFREIRGPHPAGRFINLVLIAQFEFIALAQPVGQNEYTSDTNMNSDLNLRSHGKIIIIVEFWQQFCMHSYFYLFLLSPILKWVTLTLDLSWFCQHCNWCEKQNLYIYAFINKKCSLIVRSIPMSVFRLLKINVINKNNKVYCIKICLISRSKNYICMMTHPANLISSIENAEKVSLYSFFVSNISIDFITPPHNPC